MPLQQTLMSQHQVAHLSAYRDEDIILMCLGDDSRALFSNALEKQYMTRLRWADSLDDLLHMCREREPGLLILADDTSSDSVVAALELLRAILKNNVPVMISLRHEDNDARMLAFRLGVTEVLTDSVSEEEIVLRIARIIERQQLLENQKLDRRRFNDHLRAAQRMQQALLQSEDAVNVIAAPRHVSVDSYYRASNVLGADWWRVVPIDKDKIGLLMFDLSGHGLSSAINAFRLQLLIENLRENRARPAIWMTELNQLLHGMLAVEQFASGFYGVYDRREQTLEYVNAGNPPPMIVRAERDHVESLQSNGPILGVSSSVVYEHKTVELDSYDRIVIYSDALYEDFTNPEQMLSEDQVREKIFEAALNAEATGEPYCKMLLAEIDDGGKRQFDDDLTLLSMRVLPVTRRPKSVSEKPIKNGIWVAFANEIIGSEIADRLSADHDLDLWYGDNIPPDSTVAILVADEGNASAVLTARAHAPDLQKIILLSDDPSEQQSVDFLLPSDANVETVRSVTKAAVDILEQNRTLRKEVSLRKSAIGTINQGTFTFATLDQARNLSTMLALACPDADLVAIGLQELMVNAVEHGNLGITARQKNELLLSGRWREEIESRLENPKYQSRKAVVDFRREESRIVIRISDEGDGFAFERLSETTNDPNAYRGRGISLAKQLSFSEVNFQGKGNIVEAIIYFEAYVI